MTAGDAYVEGPLGTVHHEMDSKFIITMFIICAVNSKSRTRPVEEVCWPILMMNLQWQDIEFPDSGIHSTRKLFTDHMAFYYTKGLLYMSMILLREGGMKKA